MGLFERIGRVVRANVNDLVNKAEDPEKVLDQAVIDMQNQVVELRKAVAGALATQKRIEQQYKENEKEAASWQKRAQLALQKGDENLARQALTRKKGYSETAAQLKEQLEQQITQIEQLKRNLTGLESKISEAKTKKDMLKARMSAAKANQQVQNTVSDLNTSSAMAAFERMEDKVLQMEAVSQSAAELAGESLEDEFAKLEAGSDIEAELAAMKSQQLLESQPAQQSLPASSQDDSSTQSQEESQSQEKSPSQQSSAIDAELEALRAQLKKMN